MATINVTGVGPIPSGSFNLPPWVGNSGLNFYIFAGVEVLAIYIASEDKWYVKATPCNRCGDCCADMGITHPNFIYPTVGDACIHMKSLGNFMDCAIGSDRSLACAIKPEPHNISNYSNCSITYFENTPIGMDLDITIPEWMQYRPFWFIVGRELFAGFNAGVWFYKKKRCDNCGDCCKGLSEQAHIFPLVGDVCAYLDTNNECTIGMNCCLSCALDPNLIGEPNCNINYGSII